MRFAGRPKTQPTCAAMHNPTLTLLQESNQVAVRFLLTNLNSALRILEVSGSTKNQTTPHNRQEAYRAYCMVSRLVDKVKPSPEEDAELKKGLKELRTRLESAGISCDA